MEDVWLISRKYLITAQLSNYSLITLCNSLSTRHAGKKNKERDEVSGIPSTDTHLTNITKERSVTEL